MTGLTELMAVASVVWLELLAKGSVSINAIASPLFWLRIFDLSGHNTENITFGEEESLFPFL